MTEETMETAAGSAAEETELVKPTSIHDLRRKMRVKGRVERLELYGAFIDLGLETNALVHISKMGKGHVNRVSDVLNVGDEVEVWIDRVEPEQNQIMVTMVEPLAVEWSDLEEGKEFTGVVKRLENFGAFVDIGAEREGLVHISELSWSRIKHPSEVVNVGDSIEVYVKDIDAEAQKVSLGYKKQEDNPWERLKNDFPVGSTFTAPVVSLTQFGAFVRILPGVDGLVHISEISYDRVEKVADVLEVGQEVEVKLLDVDFDRRRISLSIKALLPEPEQDAPRSGGDALVASASADETTVAPDLAAELDAQETAVETAALEEAGQPLQPEPETVPAVDPEAKAVETEAMLEATEEAALTAPDTAPAPAAEDLAAEEAAMEQAADEEE